jgi:hypothetical protein
MQRGLGTVLVVVHDIDLEPALHAHQRRHQADRPGAGDEHTLRRPARAAADALDVLPRLGQHARRLEQDARQAQHRRHLRGERRIGAPALGAEAVGLLDAALREAAVAAHVPFAERAVRAGHRIGMAHDPHDEVADREAAARRRADHPPEGLVPKDQALLPGAGAAVEAFDQLAVGAADAHGERAHEQRAVLLRRLGDVIEALRVVLAGL